MSQKEHTTTFNPDQLRAEASLDAQRVVELEALARVSGVPGPGQSEDFELVADSASLPPVLVEGRPLSGFLEELESQGELDLIKLEPLGPQVKLRREQ